LRSIKGIIDLPARKPWILKEDIAHSPAGCIIKGLYAETIISTRWVIIWCLWRWDKDRRIHRDEKRGEREREKEPDLIAARETAILCKNQLF